MRSDALAPAASRKIALRPLTGRGRKLPRTCQLPDVRGPSSMQVIETNIPVVRRVVPDALRRCAGLVLGDVPGGRAGPGRHRRRLHPGQPVLLRPARHGARPALPAPSDGPGQADPGARRRHPGRRRRPAARLAHLRPARGRAPRRARTASSSTSRSASGTASAPWSPTPWWPTRSPAGSTAPSTMAACSGTIRRSASPGR